jgi:hypothetical protein
MGSDPQSQIMITPIITVGNREIFGRLLDVPQCSRVINVPPNAAYKKKSMSKMAIVALFLEIL